MARRFSDDPVYRIQILPSKGKVATRNPPQPSFSRFALEAGATVVRTLAHVLMLWSKSLRVVTVDVDRQAQDLRHWVDQGAAWVAASLRRAGRWIARIIKDAKDWGKQTWHEMRTPVYPLRPAVEPSNNTSRELVSVIQCATPEGTRELDQLRAHVATQEQGLSRLTSQVMELRALAMSQQQVLLYLGKELDAMQLPVVRVEADPLKKIARRAKKSAKAKRVTPSRVVHKASVSL